jgi:hypothetical protein
MQAPTSGPVPRPLFAGDVQPGMRIFAGSGWGSFGPATVLPDGLIDLGGGMVTVKAMGDDGLVGVLTVPACQTIVELVDAPPLDDQCGGLYGCPCGGAWPTLAADPHPPRRITGDRPIFGIGARSVLDTFLATKTTDCGGEDCCPTCTDSNEDLTGDDSSDCTDRAEPYEPGGYL